MIFKLLILFIIFPLNAFIEAQEGDNIKKKFASEIGVVMIGSIISKKNDNIILLKNKENGKVKAHRVGFSLFKKYIIEEIHSNYMMVSLKSAKKNWIKIYKDGFVESASRSIKPKKKKIGMTDQFKEEGFFRDKNKIDMSKEYKENIIRNDLPKILMQASAEPVIENGSIVGFLLDQIDPGSIYAKAGLKNGDIVVSINEIALTDITATIKLLHSLKKSSDISFVIHRQGQPIDVQINVK